MAPLTCQGADDKPNAPAYDLEGLARVFGVGVVKTTDSDGGEIWTVKTVAGTVKQTFRNGRLETTSTEPEIDFDTNSNQPGARIVKTTKDDGTNVVEFRRGGVALRQERKNNTVVLTEVTEPGKDAPILCSRVFLIVQLVSLDACFPGTHEDTRAELKYDIDEITKFIAKNSLFPLTLEQSQFFTEQILRQYTVPVATLPTGSVRKDCQSGEAHRWAGEALAATPAKLRKALEDSIRVPRPPLMCTGL